MARKLAAVVFLLGGLHAASALSLGLGGLQLQSFLNEPLNASVELVDMGGMHADEVIIRLASRDDFERFGLDRPYFLSSIKFQVSVQKNGAASIILSSEEPVLEPYLEFILEARWPSGRLLREYTVLLDPPLFTEVEALAGSAGQRVDVIDAVPARTKNDNEAISRGTLVEIPSIGAAPGAMPQRDYNATAVLSPRPGSRYMINQADTLWRIASLAKPRGASVQQTMLDIQRLNPDAFVDGNINTVKAGYIVDLPGESDISSADASLALAEVREQNAAWREGRDVAIKPANGPSLTISTDANNDTAAEGVDVKAGAARSDEAKVAPEPPSVAQSSSSDAAAAPSLADEMQQRLLLAEEQLKTLQRIITVKDDQIAALQSALVAAGAAVDAVDAEAKPRTAVASSESLPAGEESLPATTATGVAAPPDAAQGSADGVESKGESPQSTAPVDVTKAVPATAADVAAAGGWLQGLFAVLGVVALGLVALFLVRRRMADDEALSHAPVRRPGEGVSADALLKEHGLNVGESADKEAVSPVVAATDDDASEAASVLADVDIYLLYGRQSQAINLLNNAIAGDPDNPLYKRKLLEIEVPGNDPSATSAELQLESPDRPSDGVDDMDLPIDFSTPSTAGLDSEELVIAADGYGLSTKLDLARAYLDMGDDEAARQILEEVVAEGTDDLKIEACALLERMGE